jgi:hypothetical protein
MSALSDIVMEFDGLLNELGVNHAFGGALALAYYAEPRGTVDADLMVATPFAAASQIVEHLSTRGFEPESQPQDWLPLAGVRVVRAADGAMGDLFFSYDPYHEQILAGAVEYPFVYSGGIATLRFLAPADLVVVKMSFNRPKDWVDIQAMIDFGTTIDADYVEHWLIAFRGPTMYPRVARLRQMTV